MRTGDIAYVDAAGCFYIVDRMKELIKVKGNQVAPAELESLLLEHPRLADACVVGVTIRGEEAPRAYVVVKEGGGVKEEEIAGWLAERVSRTKRLTGGVVFVEAIPKNPVCSRSSLFLVAEARMCAGIWSTDEEHLQSGKILRKILRERAKAEVGDKDPVRAKL